MSNPTHHEPTDPLDMTEEQYQRWSDEQDNRWANTCAERERDAYLDYHEAHDVQVMNDPAESGPARVAQVLRTAARYLADHGWVQGSYYDQSATVFTPAACVVGAIGMICYGGPVDAPALNYDAPGWQDFHDAITYLDGYLADVYQAVPGLLNPACAYGFNDTKNRRVDEVIAALNGAADRWDHDNDTPPWTPDPIYGGAA